MQGRERLCPEHDHTCLYTDTFLSVKTCPKQRHYKSNPTHVYLSTCSESGGPVFEARKLVTMTSALFLSPSRLVVRNFKTGHFFSYRRITINAQSTGLTQRCFKLTTSCKELSLLSCPGRRKLSMR